jgi:hypothetical protein
MHFIFYLERGGFSDAVIFLFFLRFGSEQKARDAVLYHYKTAASGFSAKLTPQQVEDLKGEFSL